MEKIVVDKRNYLAVKCLELLGNVLPTQQQIDLMEKLLAATSSKKNHVIELSQLHRTSLKKSNKDCLI